MKTLIKLVLIALISTPMQARELNYNKQVVESNCVIRNKDDFAMQAFCIQLEKKAFDDAQNIARIMPKEGEGALRNCLNKWSKSWVMRSFCMDLQYKAYRKMKD